MMRGLTSALAAFTAALWCSSCGKSESQQSPAPAAPAAPSASPLAPAAPAAGVPPEWLAPALFGSFDDGGYDRALQAILDVPDHPEGITSFASQANDSLCISLMFILAALAERTQDPRYLPVATAVARRLGDLGESDSTMVVLMMYPPQIVGIQMLATLNDDEAGPLDHCGVANWICDWRERDAPSVEAIIAAGDPRFRSLFETALTRMDRDHAVLALNAVRVLRSCGRINGEESLGLLDRWQAHFGDLQGLGSLYEAVRCECESPDR